MGEKNYKNATKGVKITHDRSSYKYKAKTIKFEKTQGKGKTKGCTKFFTFESNDFPHFAQTLMFH